MRNLLPNLLLLFSGIQSKISSETGDTCPGDQVDLDSKEKGDCLDSIDTLCSKKIKLVDIEKVDIGENNIFFIESSPKEVLSSREGCALESASRNSELHVIMVRVGKTLDLTDNTTCQIYKRFRDSISLYFVDPNNISQNTPLQNFFNGSSLERSRHRYVHTADALRLLLINKYGGFYADSDFVILKSLKSMKNVIASDQVSDGDIYDDNNHLQVGTCVTNAIFHFSKSSPILTEALDTFNKMYDPQGWATGGPDVLQRSLLTLCGFDQEHKLRFPMTRERFSRENCQGIKLLDYKSFFPIAWMNQVHLWEPKRTKREWKELFQHSYGVHFYHSSSQSAGPGQIIKSPKFYGARVPSLLALALDHCPVSYRSKNNHF